MGKLHEYLHLESEVERQLQLSVLQTETLKHYLKMAVERKRGTDG